MDTDTNSRSMRSMRYATVGFCSIILFAQANLGGSENALVSCMACCAVIMFTVNNLTFYGDYLSSYLTTAILIFVASVGAIFADQIFGGEIAPKLISISVLFAVASGITGIILAVKRSKRYRATL